MINNTPLHAAQRREAVLSAVAKTCSQNSISLMFSDVWIISIWPALLGRAEMVSTEPKLALERDNANKAMENKPLSTSLFMKI